MKLWLSLIVFLQHYERAEDASKAVEKLDDTEFMGVHIQVQVLINLEFY